MNPLTNVRNVAKLNEQDLRNGIFDHTKTWHSQYKDSAYIFIGGLPYDLSEGDILCVFSQYGEIVNINLVRDKKSGKSKGYGFLCYEDQRSTILAVDNFNGIKLGGRTIRVDHVTEYRIPKGDEKGEDGKFKEKIELGCAPKTPSPIPSDADDDGLSEYKLEKKKKKKNKDKKKKKKKEKGMNSENEDDLKDTRGKIKVEDDRGSRKTFNDRNGRSRRTRHVSRSPSSEKRYRRERSLSRDDKRGRTKREVSNSPERKRYRRERSLSRDDKRGRTKREVSNSPERKRRRSRSRSLDRYKSSKDSYRKR